MPNDIGKIQISTGESYLGYTDNGRVSGFGVFSNPYTGEYLGEWFEETQNGYGIENFTDGDKFEGKFIEGKKIIGIYSWNDGSYYEGEFENNNFNGFVSF